MPEAPKRVNRRVARVATPGAAPNKVDRRSSLRTDAATMVNTPMVNTPKMRGRIQ
jgi:hypothetical protein